MATTTATTKRERAEPCLPAFTVHARRFLNPDAYPLELADAACNAPPRTARLPAATFGDAVAKARAVARTRAFGFTDLIEIEDAAGRVVAHVSPNLRVWEGGAKCWQPGTREIVAQPVGTARSKGTSRQPEKGPPQPPRKRVPAGGYRRLLPTRFDHPHREDPKR